MTDYTPPLDDIGFVLDEIVDLAALAKLPRRDNFTEAIDLFERALALAPQSVEAQSFLAGAFSGRVLVGVGRFGRCRPRARGRPRWASLGSQRPAARWHMSPKASCCARSAASQKQFPNMRRRSRRTGIWWAHCTVSGSASCTPAR